MKKSFAFLTLAALSLTLGACGGSEEKAPEKKAEASKKKKGKKEKPHENPWAVETQGADAAKAEAKPEKKKKKKGKESEPSNPWAKDNPTPAAEE